MCGKVNCCVNQESTTIFMKATINVVCYKWKVLVNGESPLMLRISKDQKWTMRSLGISVNPKHWDFVKNEPKTSCPNNFIEDICQRCPLLFL